MLQTPHIMRRWPRRALVPNTLRDVFVFMLPLHRGAVRVTLVPRIADASNRPTTRNSTSTGSSCRGTTEPDPGPFVIQIRLQPLLTDRPPPVLALCLAVLSAADFSATPAA